MDCLVLNVLSQTLPSVVPKKSSLEALSSIASVVSR